MAGWSANPVGRVARDTALITLVLSVAAWLTRPGGPRLAFGVLGGGALIGLSFWAIKGGVDGLLRGTQGGPGGRGGRVWLLVKIFTRHAILASAAYGMMVRLRLDPVGMLIGASAFVVAVAVEALRTGTGSRGAGSGRWPAA